MEQGGADRRTNGETYSLLESLQPIVQLHTSYWGLLLPPVGNELALVYFPQGTVGRPVNRATI